MSRRPRPSPGYLLLALAALGLFVCALLESLEFLLAGRHAAALFPLALVAAFLPLCLYVVYRDARGRGPQESSSPAADDWRGMAWLTVFVMMASAFGLITGGAVATAAYVRAGCRGTWPQVLAVAMAVVVVFTVLQMATGIDLPGGTWQRYLR